MPTRPSGAPATDAVDPRGSFLVGTGRCGSTMLRKLLREHPLVYIPKETHWIPLLHDRYGCRELDWTGFRDAVGSVYMAKGKTPLARILKEEQLTGDELDRLMEPLAPRPAAGWTREIYERIATRHGATRFGDKTPDYGHCMALLLELFPGSRFVHIARDGRDVALSMREVLSFRYQVAWGVNDWPTLAWNQAYAARREQAEGTLPLESFYELWRSRLLRTRDESTRLPPDAYLEVRYETLLSEPAETLDRIGRFLDLPDGGDWIGRAAATIRSDNLGRNRTRDEHRALTARFADDLAALGFEP